MLNRTFNITNFDSNPDGDCLAKVDYDEDVFELVILNRQDAPIEIKLIEKPEHQSERKLMGDRLF